MEDVSEPQFVDPLISDNSEVAGSSKTAVIQHSENLVQNHQRLSILGQIYNWQYTGCIVKLNLPIENENNSPLFGIKVTPDWINAKFMMDRDLPDNRRVTRYCERKGWTVPLSYAEAGLNSIGSSISIIESDDQPDIAIWNQHALGWTGGLNFQLRCISNVTTQGKLVFSRQYDVNKPAMTYDPTKNRTFFPTIRQSQQWRRKNAFMIGDLSRSTDFEIQCPWISKYNFINNCDTQGAAYTGYATEHSYIWVDIAGVLSASAGASECLFEIWIQAQPDFRFIHLFAPIGPLYDAENYSRDLGLPWIFGAGTNLTYTSDDVIEHHV